MEKSKFISYLTDGYKSEIKTETIKEIANEIYLLDAKSNENSISNLASKINSEMPHINAINDYFIRIKLSRIESHLNTIKIIIVLVFIISIIAAFVMILSA